MINDSEFDIKIFSPTCFHCKKRILDKKLSCEMYEDIPVKIWNGESCDYFEKTS